MPTYTVFSIEPPASPSQLAAYKTLRLTSLQMDPQAFVSNYAREVAFSEDVWRERLDSPYKRAIVASVRRNHDASHPTCILPSWPHSKKLEWVPNWEIYALYAMWVHPAHRGKGVGAQLVNACLEWARTNVDIKFLNEKGGDSEKVVALLVYNDNVAGRTLYSRTGFTDIEGVPAEEGERWMLARV
ncbi:hypothetical protein JVT61DRAFT_929 [Boletus reticuloceps]|uniref:N-acetyltransferase domain-containing protein n=1 Tax=Boletus reticuloceps TaxID=495285 RepID=A0A8I2YRM7_9AGAM|nr:hypothetical protein JVT61DRAFT_929 [Boletus reticuloceps]